MQTRAPIRRPLFLFFELIIGLALLSCGGDSATTPEATGPTTLSIAIDQIQRDAVRTRRHHGHSARAGVVRRVREVKDRGGGGETVSYVGATRRVIRSWSLRWFRSKRTWRLAVRSNSPWPARTSARTR